MACSMAVEQTIMIIYHFLAIWFNYLCKVESLKRQIEYNIRFMKIEYPIEKIIKVPKTSTQDAFRNRLLMYLKLSHFKQLYKVYLLLILLSYVIRKNNNMLLSWSWHLLLYYQIITSYLHYILSAQNVHIYICFRVFL